MDVPAARSARAVVQCYPSSARAPRPSSSSARPSSLKPWQRRGITFPLSSGHFALASVPPPIPSRGDGASSGARRSQGHRRQPGAAGSGAAWPTPPARVILSRSHRARPGGLGRAALRAWALPPGALHGFPGSGRRVRARARAPSFSALPPLPPPPPPLRSGRRLLGLIGIRNPFNLQRSKLTSARVRGGGWGRGHRGGGSRQTGNISPLGSARFCVLPPSALRPPPSSGSLGR